MVRDGRSDSPYMLFVAVPVAMLKRARRQMNDHEKALFGIDKLNVAARSSRYLQ